MSRTPDRRPIVREAAFTAVDLSWREKAYLVRVTELPTEMEDDGRRRYGSNGMDADGFFSLHRDYVAKSLGSHPDAVKKAQEECVRKGYLSLVWSARHGLPTRLQALLHRGVESGTLEGVKTTPLCGEGDDGHRGVETTHLPLYTPDHPDHPSSSGGFPEAANEVAAARRRQPRHNVGAQVQECPFHEHVPCAEDCAFHPANQEASA